MGRRRRRARRDDDRRWPRCAVLRASLAVPPAREPDRRSCSERGDSLHAALATQQALEDRSAAPGIPRQPDRPGEPRPAARPGRARAGGVDAAQRHRGGLLLRPRRLQGCQRQPRPPRRRPGAGRRQQAARRRSCGPATPSPGSAATSSRSCSRTSRTSSRSRRWPSGSSRCCTSPPIIDGQEIYLSASVGVAFAGVGTTTETPAERSRRRDVRRQGDRQGQVRGVRDGHALARRRPDGADQRVPGFAAPLRVLPRVPAAAAPVRRCARGVRGAGALAAPRRSAWSAPTGSSRSPRRPASSCRSAAGCSSRPASRQPDWTAPSGSPADACRSTCPAASCRIRNLLQDVRTALSFSGLPPQRLVLEITESVLMINRDGHRRRPAAVPRHGRPASRSTTSAPATRRSATCASSRSTSSRSTSRSSICCGDPSGDGTTLRGDDPAAGRGPAPRRHRRGHRAPGPARHPRALDCHSARAT